MSPQESTLRRYSLKLALPLFGILGPPIGFFCGIFYDQDISLEGLLTDGLPLASIIMITYMIGLIPALCAGFAISRMGRKSSLLREALQVLIISVLIGLVTVVFAVPLLGKLSLYGILFWIGLCVPPTMICWFILRLLSKR